MRAEADGPRGKTRIPGLGSIVALGRSFLAIGGGPISCYMRPLVCAGLESNRRRADAHEIGPRAHDLEPAACRIPASLVPSGPASGARLLPAAWAFPLARSLPEYPVIPC